jgi:hypothetical protein
MPGDPSHVIALFTDFLEAFSRATASERRAFLDFISPQSREDLIHLADAIKEKAAAEERRKGEKS